MAPPFQAKFNGRAIKAHIPMSEKEFAEVFISQNGGEARLVLEILKSSGLDAVMFDDYASGSVAGFGPAIPARVVVPAGQEKAALEILAAMQK
jgi:hypothetical protein